MTIRAAHAAVTRVQARRGPNAYLIVAVVLLVASLGLVGWVLRARSYSDRLMSQRAHAAVQAVAEEWTPQQRRAVTDAAHAYNARLLAQGSPVIGDAVDPFTGGVIERADTDYQGTMRLTDSGIMGRILVPAIGVDLPILHGTDDDSLRQGAGHLYGTSVPIGGPGTLSVISAHSGQVTSTGFLRLSELDDGDLVFIQTMGETLAYMVDGSEVIEPTDFSHFVIRPGEDRIILTTCTPVGINSQRLLVYARRTQAPDVSIDAPRAAGSEHFGIVVAVLAVVVAAAGIVVGVVRCRRRAQHAP